MEPAATMSPSDPSSPSEHTDTSLSCACGRRTWEKEDCDYCLPLYKDCEYVGGFNNNMFAYAPIQTLDANLFTALVSDNALKKLNFKVECDMNHVTFDCEQRGIGNAYINEDNYPVCAKCKHIVPIDREYYSLVDPIPETEDGLLWWHTYTLKIAESALTGDPEPFVFADDDHRSTDASTHLCHLCAASAIARGVPHPISDSNSDSISDSDLSANTVLQLKRSIVSTGLGNVRDWVRIFTYSYAYTGDNDSMFIDDVSYYCNLNPTSVHFGKFAKNAYTDMLGNYFRVIKQLDLSEVIRVNCPMHSLA